MIRVVLPSAVSAALAASSSAQLTGYEPLIDWESLSWSKAGLQSELYSSYDRAGENLDYSQFLSPTGHQTGDLANAVVASVDGPGVVRRFWMPHATANSAFDLRVYVDGVKIYDTNTDAYLDGTVGYVDPLLTTTLLGGQTSYEPIVFQESLLIESNNFNDSASNPFPKRRNYYQHNVHALPAGARVVPTTGTLDANQLAARNQALQVVQSAGTNPAGASGTAVLSLTSPQSIAAGSTLTLASPGGSGTVRALNLMMAGATDAELDALRLRVRYDGDTTNAIDIPISQFFGVGAGRFDYQSLPLGVADDGSFYSYWPMPFRQGAVVELHNPSGAPIAIDSAGVEVEPGQVAPQAGYLHAVYHEQTTVADQEHHQLLDVQGKGHYVGNLLWFEASGNRRRLLEGDDIITVDGTEVLFGTGMEDAYNGGYYYNHVVVQTDDGDIPNPESGGGPFAGLMRLDINTLGDTQTRADQYRWLIADPVAFDQSIDVKIENFDQLANIDFGSTAFYYLIDAIAGDLNGDGGVGIDDLDIVLRNWGPAARLGDWTIGDATNDGWVGEDDLQVVLDNWNAGNPPPSVNVPEPGTAAVLGAVLLGAVRRRR